MAKKLMDYDFLFKTIIIGDSGVGKSSIMLRQCDDSFNFSHISTIGVDFRYNTVEVDGKKVKLQIWDTAGQERFRTITAAYYRSSEIAVIVFDVTNKASYTNVNRWITECKNHGNQKIKLFLIGNKCDATNRVITKEEVTKYAQQLDIVYMETSAKTGFGVADAFHTIAKNAIDNRLLVSTTSNNNIIKPLPQKHSFCNFL